MNRGALDAFRAAAGRARDEITSKMLSELTSLTEHHLIELIGLGTSYGVQTEAQAGQPAASAPQHKLAAQGEESAILKDAAEVAHDVIEAYADELLEARSDDLRELLNRHLAGMQEAQRSMRRALTSRYPSRGSLSLNPARPS